MCNHIEMYWGWKAGSPVTQKEPRPACDDQFAHTSHFLHPHVCNFTQMDLHYARCSFPSFCHRAFVFISLLPPSQVPNVNSLSHQTGSAMSKSPCSHLPWRDPSYSWKPSHQTPISGAKHCFILSTSQGKYPRKPYVTSPLEQSHSFLFPIKIKTKALK